MTPAGIKGALIGTYGDMVRNHTLQMAAALAYYFVLSFFPALIFLSAVVAFLPVPDLFNEALALMARFLPADSMGLVRRVLAGCGKTRSEASTTRLSCFHKTT